MAHSPWRCAWSELVKAAWSRGGVPGRPAMLALGAAAPPFAAWILYALPMQSAVTYPYGGPGDFSPAAFAGIMARSPHACLRSSRRVVATTYHRCPAGRRHRIVDRQLSDAGVMGDGPETAPSGACDMDHRRPGRISWRRDSPSWWLRWSTSWRQGRPGRSRLACRRVARASPPQSLSWACSLGGR